MGGHHGRIEQPPPEGQQSLVGQNPPGLPRQEAEGLEHLLAVAQGACDELAVKLQLVHGALVQRGLEGGQARQAFDAAHDQRDRQQHQQQGGDREAQQREWRGIPQPRLQGVARDEFDEQHKRQHRQADHHQPTVQAQVQTKQVHPAQQRRAEPGQIQHQGRLRAPCQPGRQRGEQQADCQRDAGRDEPAQVILAQRIALARQGAQPLLQGGVAEGRLGAPVGRPAQDGKRQPVRGQQIVAEPVDIPRLHLRAMRQHAHARIGADEAQAALRHVAIKADQRGHRRARIGLHRPPARRPEEAAAHGLAQLDRFALAERHAIEQAQGEAVGVGGPEALVVPPQPVGEDIRGGRRACDEAAIGLEQGHRIAATRGDGHTPSGIEGEIDGTRAMRLQFGRPLRVQPLAHARAGRVEKVQRCIAAHTGDDGAARLAHEVGRCAGQAGGADRLLVEQPPLRRDPP